MTDNSEPPTQEPKRLKAAQVRKLLGLSPRQLALRRNRLGKGGEYVHGYPLEAIETFIETELAEIAERREVLISARKNLKDAMDLQLKPKED